MELEIIQNNAASLTAVRLNCKLFSHLCGNVIILYMRRCCLSHYASGVPPCAPLCQVCHCMRPCVRCATVCAPVSGVPPCEPLCQLCHRVKYALCQVCRCVRCVIVLSMPLCQVCSCVRYAPVSGVPLCYVCNCVKCKCAPLSSMPFC